VPGTVTLYIRTIATKPFSTQFVLDDFGSGGKIVRHDPGTGLGTFESYIDRLKSMV
jgi:hypothetical protein